MSKRKRCKTKFNEEWIVDGIDVANIWNHTTKEVLAAEAKNHAPEIQYMIGKHLYNVYQKEFDALEKKLKKEYGDDYEKISEIESSIMDPRSLEWYKKAADQNYAPAQYQLYLIYDDEDYGNDKKLAYDYFRLSLDQYYYVAVEDYIRMSRDNELPEDFPKYDEKELIRIVCEKEDGVWNEAYESFEGKDLFKNISKINAHLYKMMFAAYDQVWELKTQLDSLIKQGKTYYKNYEIRCGIGLYPEEEYKTKDGKEFEGADCEWELVSTYKKKLPEKMKALSLWENYHFGPFKDLTHDYVCKAMYSFACPKIEKDEGRYVNFKVPMEILDQAKSKDFYLNINLTFGKNKLVKKFTHEEWEDWRHDNYCKKFHMPSIWRLGFLKPWRILSQAKSLLRIELESADLTEQILKDFNSVYKNSKTMFTNPKVGMSLSYDHKRPFGIKTKGDSLIENEIQIMCGLGGIGSGNLDNHSNQNDIPQWCEPFIFMNPPYNKHYMCFANHGIWDHCSLRTDQVLNLKPKNFSWTCEVSFDNYGCGFEDDEPTVDGKKEE